jgi:hypothetical protein
MFESYEVVWRDGEGEWRTVKTGLTESQALAYAAEYKKWTIRVFKAVRTEIHLVETENDSK